MSEELEEVVSPELPQLPLDREEDTALDFTEYYHVLKVLYARPCVTVIKGKWQKGKTDMGLGIAQDLIQLGIVREVGSNIKVKEPPSWWFDVSSVDKLAIWSRHNHLTKALVIDELAKNFPRRAPMARKIVKFLELLPELSKGKLRVIGITQELEGADAEITENPVYVRGVFNKIDLSFSTLSAPDLWDEPIELRDIPPTTLKFDRDESAPFTLHEVTKEPDWMSANPRWAQVIRWLKGETWEQVGLMGTQGSRALRDWGLTVLDYLSTHDLNA